MSTTALNIANRALRILGEPKITAFSSTGSVPEVISDMFFDAFFEVMSEDAWYFLNKRAVISDHASAWANSEVYAVGDGCRHNNETYNAILASSDTAPLIIEPGVHASSTLYWETQTDRLYADYTGWDYKYDLPSDLYRALEIAPQYEFVMEGLWLYTDYVPDSTNLYPTLLYQVDVVSSDGNGDPVLDSTYRTRMPAWFERAVATRLAMDTAISITGKESEYKRCRTEHYIALQKAMDHNAMATPGPLADETDPWSDPPG